MFKRIFLGLVLIALFSVTAVFAQDPTATPPPQPTLPPEPTPVCPSYADESRDARVGYFMGEGLAYLGNNQLNQAWNSFSCIARGVNDAYVPAWMGRARVYYQLREFQRAFNDLNSVVQLNSNLVAAYNDRGVIFMQWNDFPRAAADFERAMDIDPSYTPAFSNRAVLHIVQGEYDAAIELLETKIRETNIDGILTQYRDPDRNEDNPILFEATHARLYALLGIAYERQALDEFRNYVELYDKSGSFPDDRVASATGALESRFTFEMRLDDGSWLLLSDYPQDAGV